jgi:hypothetical protein
VDINILSFEQSVFVDLSLMDPNAEPLSIDLAALLPASVELSPWAYWEIAANQSPLNGASVDENGTFLMSNWSAPQTRDVLVKITNGTSDIYGMVHFVSVYPQAVSLSSLVGTSGPQTLNLNSLVMGTLSSGSWTLNTTAGSLSAGATLTGAGP